MPGPILVVDDDASNRVLMEEILQSQGFVVITASNGREGLDLVAKHSPDVVLLDIMMPMMDGFEACRRIKENPETALTPVVLVTALSASQDRLRGIEAGADDFLNKPYDPSEMLARVRSLVKLKARTDELERAEVVLFALARSIEAKDPYTSGHCERLASLSAGLGDRIGLASEQIVALRRGGIVHDIGKVAVPDSILLKRGPLNEEEWRIMREHPLVGERICAPLKSFRLVLPIIRSHHERFDGSGYPDGLRGEAIPITARIMQLADVYDALTTERPYKPAFAEPEALRIMESEVAKGWWDRQLFAEFRRLVEQSATLMNSESAGVGSKVSEPRQPARARSARQVNATR